MEQTAKDILNNMKFDWDHFKEYVNTYNPKNDGLDNAGIIFNDMLYGLGICLDENLFKHAGGYKKFKQFVKSVFNISDNIVEIEQKEELKIYRELLIKLHTARWTGNSIRVMTILDVIAAYSYARTNTNGDEEQEQATRNNTLEKLSNV